MGQIAIDFLPRHHSNTPAQDKKKLLLKVLTKQGSLPLQRFCKNK
jgi:hypothetical protein